jgi:hypothetical protein
MKSVYPIFTRSDIIFRHSQVKINEASCLLCLRLRIFKISGLTVLKLPACTHFTEFSPHQPLLPMILTYLLYNHIIQHIFAVISYVLLIYLCVFVCHFFYGQYKDVRTLSWSSTSKGEGGIAVSS